MPNLAEHPSSSVTKLLLIGDSGSGKTGSLASLAHAGYNLRIVDLDNGLDILRNLLTDPNSPYGKDAHTRVNYVTITEKHTSISVKGSIGAPTSATVWNRTIQLLSRWKDGQTDFGPITSWTPRDVLVIDSMTLAGIAALNFAVVTSGAKDGRMMYFHAQNYLEYLMQLLYGDDVNCNVIVTSHINFLEDEVTNLSRGYPATIGSKLSSKIGRYFNSILLARSEGKSRRLYTSANAVRVELKSSSPLRVKEWYDIKFGLAEYFKDVQASGAAASPPEAARAFG